MDKKKTVNLNIEVSDSLIDFTLSTTGSSITITPESNSSYEGWAYSLDDKLYYTFLGFESQVYVSPDNDSKTIYVKGFYDGKLSIKTSQKETGLPVTTPTFTPASYPAACIPKEVNVSINSDNKYVFGGDYHEPFRLGLGVYKLNVPSSHPIVLVGHDPAKIKMSGDNVVSGNPAYAVGRVNDVEITGYEDFDTVSYACVLHGAMGGDENLTFSNDCEPGYDIPITPTLTITPLPPYTGNTTFSSPPFMKSNNSNIEVELRVSKNGSGQDGGKHEIVFKNLHLDFSLLPSLAKQTSGNYILNAFITKPNVSVSSQYSFTGIGNNPGSNNDLVYGGFEYGNFSLDRPAYIVPTQVLGQTEIRDYGVFQTKGSGHTSWSTESFGDARFWHFRKVNDDYNAVETRGPHSTIQSIWTHYQSTTYFDVVQGKEVYLADGSDENITEHEFSWYPSGSGTGLAEIRIILHNASSGDFAEYAISANQVKVVQQ